MKIVDITHVYVRTLIPKATKFLESHLWTALHPELVACGTAEFSYFP